MTEVDLTREELIEALEVYTGILEDRIARERLREHSTPLTDERLSRAYAALAKLEAE